MYANNVNITNNLTLQSGVTISGLDYLPLTGGTMIGDIVMTGGTINSTGGIELDFNTFGNSSAFAVTSDSGAYGEGFLYVGDSFGVELSSYNNRVYSYSQTNTTIDSNGLIYINAYNDYLRLQGNDIILSDANNFSGTSLYTLGIDATGRITTAVTASAIFTGGTVTGPTTFQDTVAFESTVTAAEITTSGVTSDDTFIMDLNGGVNETVYIGDNTSTTDATVTTISTYATTTRRTYHFKAVITALRSDFNASLSMEIVATFRSNGIGTLSQVGATNKITNSEFTTADADFVISGTDILLRVTGEAVTNIAWKSNITLNK
jgi:hypothetical protein